MMKKFLMNRITVNTILIFVVTFVSEMYLRFLTNSEMFCFATIRILFSSLGIAILWSYLFHFFKPIVQQIANTLYSITISVLFFVEACLYFYLGFFMGVGNTSQGTKVLDYIRDVLATMNFKVWGLWIPLLLALVYFTFFEDALIEKIVAFQKKENNNPKKYRAIVPILIVILIFFTYSFTIRSEFVRNKFNISSTYVAMVSTRII